MKSNQVLKGALIVAAGASSYGLLATFVKLAYKDGFNTAEVTISQLLIGLIVMSCLTWIRQKQNPTSKISIIKGDITRLILAGTSIGLTSLFYYLSVRYLNVSVAIVLLMQSTWISVLLEAILNRTWPSLPKVVAVGIVLGGTLLATNVFNSNLVLDYRGFIFGMLAAISFTLTMYASNRVANYLPAYKKSSWMLLGGFFIVLFFGLISYEESFKFSIFYKYGLFLALFGTILPPLAFNIGFPKTGLGIGSIVSALELPVSIFMAFLLLNERINLWQIIGILLILSAIVLMNLSQAKRTIK
ncbi:MAG: EamA/RhaT family transporter [Pedobacter sp.]|nr:MAG: EamA/RhaT family transporter [Pedobacter sp.]